MKIDSIMKPKIIWTIIALLLILCASLYSLKEKERELRMAKEEELLRTIEAKRIVEGELTEAKKEIAKKEGEIKLTLDKLEKEMTARQEAEVRIMMVLEEKRDLEARLEELTASMPKSVELEKIVIRAGPTLNGKVLSFNSELKFVVVDLGRKDNLKVGDVLSVYREDNLVGRIQVEKVEERASAAALLAPWQDVEYKESDTVRRI